MTECGALASQRPCPRRHHRSGHPTHGPGRGRGLSRPQGPDSNGGECRRLEGVGGVGAVRTGTGNLLLTFMLHKPEQPAPSPGAPSALAKARSWGAGAAEPGDLPWGRGARPQTVLQRNSRAQGWPGPGARGVYLKERQLSWLLAGGRSSRAGGDSLGGKGPPCVSRGPGRGGAGSAGSRRVTGPLRAPHWLRPQRRASCPLLARGWQGSEEGPPGAQATVAAESPGAAPPSGPAGGGGNRPRA